jgi:hypothetical protein
MAAAPVAASVAVTGPPNWSYYSRGGSVGVAGRVQTAPGQAVTCTADWSDGTLPTGPYAATEIAPGTYSCPGGGHIWVNSGTHTITLTAYVDNAPIGTASVIAVVF